MADDNRTRRFAVLIDADNTSPSIAAGLFEEIAKFGEASVRASMATSRARGCRSWADILQKYAIDPYQQFAYTTGKNASDIALVIDAMDLLHSGRFDGFCLVSSDSDFTRLRSRLREEGPTSTASAPARRRILPPGLPPLHLHREPAARGAAGAPRGACRSASSRPAPRCRS
jgi:hypothetical protein